MIHLAGIEVFCQCHTAT